MESFLVSFGHIFYFSTTFYFSMVIITKDAMCGGAQMWGGPEASGLHGLPVGPGLPLTLWEENPPRSLLPSRNDNTIGNSLSRQGFHAGGEHYGCMGALQPTALRVAWAAQKRASRSPPPVSLAAALWLT